MIKLQTLEPLESYLQTSEFVDFHHPDLEQLIRQLQSTSQNALDLIRSAFEYVRDHIPHSWDIQSPRVTVRASEAYACREGICYAKSNLLAALLRGMGIPSGFCYQRLTIGDTPETGFCIHALNTVWIQAEQRWIRLDARGNKPGVDAQFSLGEEQLAFSVRPECDEVDYLVNLAQPHPKTMHTLLTHQNADCREMYLHHLPEALSAIRMGGFFSFTWP
jgi:transglutaminase-like putative cysteine protease